ncbi:MAG TPA: pyridoxal-dependent decarboxylase [Miltoncostaeaceae bacterium]|nr:pyridoxal-dependent decarboxylase [Miltoncostaeaceae bacterium]
MGDIRRLLETTAAHAADFLEGLDERPVGVSASPAELHAAIDRPLPEEGTAPEVVLEELVRDCDPGLLGSPTGRFFGFVIGGTLPSAIAADWMTSAWDQNTGIHVCGPSAAVAEEVAGAWLKELLGLPAEASFALVTGCQMAHVTCLAAARNHLLAARGWDVERRGLAGAPAIRVLASPDRHDTVDRAVRLIGLGVDSVEPVASDETGRMAPEALAEALALGDGAPAIVVAQAGQLNSGAFDDFGAIADLARPHGAWVHVDGAFGLWAAASRRLRHLVAGVERADSWSTDGHKWLNTPYDLGIAVVAHPEPHTASMSVRVSYLPHSTEARDPVDWTPEFSRRARGFTAYAAIRELGRRGVEDLVERCSDAAAAIVAGIGALPDAQVVAEPVINQGLLRFLSPDGEHDRRTDEVIASVQAGGEAWFGGAAWHGMRVMRVSVSGWRTGARDVERAVAAVDAALRAPAAPLAS